MTFMLCYLSSHLRLGLAWYEQQFVSQIRKSRRRTRLNIYESFNLIHRPTQLGALSSRSPPPQQEACSQIDTTSATLWPKNIRLVGQVWRRKHTGKTHGQISFFPGFAETLVFRTLDKTFRQKDVVFKLLRHTWQFQSCFGITCI